MITLNCPWCEGAIAFEADATEIRCDACSVAVELPPDASSATDLPAAA